MKRLVLSLALLLAAAGLHAGTITKYFDNLKKFSGIQICNSFDATLEMGDDYRAKVTIDTDYEEYLDVSVVGTVLYVRLKEPPRRLKDLTRKTMKVTITAPSLCQIYLTGASRLKSVDEWESEMEPFTLEVSGAAKAEKLRLTAVKLNATVSDATSCSVIGDFGELNAAVSGASAVTFSGDFEDIVADVGGTAKITIVGTADTIASVCNGSSYLDAAQLNVDKANIICNGASKAVIDVNERLEVDLSGVSTCHYSTKNNALTVVPSVSRASSFKKIN
ncbi:MAG: DUF2807 domain-containing protein [Bacteroidales bacterium]|nr:DUF2807 domain-containing protein [Bacteroidales bacterium]